ncbi:MAG TPA: TonB-dependent receptor [Limnobacter sp.]|uniref:TonB-dependent receptor n=1 Tax=Limnobacter sp. TaxID=2003368 RepID=UPI002ED805CE
MRLHPFTHKPLVTALLILFGQLVWAVDEPTKELGVVTINSGRPSSLPTQIPATMEGITAEQAEQSINARDSEDYLKYFPSLLVRKRYEGDYNHAILSSRASGTGNPARSAVYADGILLSNYLGNSVGGLSFPPRWNMVTPEEIERVDVMYGPFSAAYPGNSVGAVVDYITRMPEQLEAHAKLGYSEQPFKLYNTDSTYRSWSSSASLGNKTGDWSWFANLSHTDSQGQPLTFARRTVSTGAAPTNGVPVNGAVADTDPTGAPIYVLGGGTQYNTVQDHLKFKVAYDISPTLRASYLVGIWQNDAKGRPSSYLTNAATGQPVTSGPIVINGRQFSSVNGGDFPLTNEEINHVMHGFSLKSNTKGTWDWEASASLYDYDKDLKRQNSAANTLPNASTGGAGTIADGSGTGWINLALKGTWRPTGLQGEHIVDFGVQQDFYNLSYRTSNIAGNWITDPAGAQASFVGGETQMTSLYAQDTWAFAPKWKTVLGLRSEYWEAKEGVTQITATNLNTSYPTRKANFLSPKAALSYQWTEDSTLKAAVGRAVRMPTVFELYGATSTTNSQFINDPNLNPEKSITGELSWEKVLNAGLLRLTYFRESTKDGLFSQSIFDPIANTTVSRVQNVGRIETQGIEAVLNTENLMVRGLDFSGSITYTQSEIRENNGFVSTPGDTIGKDQPNIPKVRATALFAYHFDEKLTGSVGARYSGRQYRTLNNSDINGYTYMGVSKYFTVDARVHYKLDSSWSVAAGIDNLNNYQYWNFHPYPQRTFMAELKYDMR